MQTKVAGANTALRAVAVQVSAMGGVRPAPPADPPPSGRALRFQPAWLLSARDFAWRWRRYVIASIATGLVLGLALLLSGIAAGFNNEIRRTMHSFGASVWLVSQGSSGPFTAPVVFAASRVSAARAEPGVQHADPLAIVVATSSERDVNVLGVVPGGVGSPRGSAAGVLARGEAIADSSLDLQVGQQLRLNGVRFRVGALTHGLTYFAGTPTVRLALGQAQRLGFNGQALASAIVTQGVPQRAPAGFNVLNNAQVAKDMARPVAQAKQTIALIRSLLWFLAATIIGTILYLTALDRVRDFAVLKAIGVGDRSLLGGLVLQAVALSFGSALLAVGFAAAMAPEAGMPVEVPLSSYLILFVLATIVGTAGSLLAFWRAAAVDPATAFER